MQGHSLETFHMEMCHKMVPRKKGHNLSAKVPMRTMAQGEETLYADMAACAAQS